MAEADSDNTEFAAADDPAFGDDEDDAAAGLQLDYDYVDEVQEGDEDGLVETIDSQGRRHIRRAAPEGTEQLLENEAPRNTGLPDKAERWRLRSATGTVLTAFAFGLKEVFEPDRNQPAIVMETSGDPPTDLPVEAQLEQLGPRQSSVKVRSWLLGNNLPGKAGPRPDGDRSGEAPQGRPEGDESTP